MFVIFIASLTLINRLNFLGVPFSRVDMLPKRLKLTMDEPKICQPTKKILFFMVKVAKFPDSVKIPGELFNFR